MISDCGEIVQAIYVSYVTLVLSFRIILNLKIKVDKIEKNVHTIVTK